MRRILVTAHIRVRIVLLVKVRKRMVDLPVLAFISADVEQKIPHRTMTLRHIPVLNRQIRCLHLLPRIQLPCVDVLDLAGVGQDCFLLEIADKAVASAWRDEVGDEEGVEKDTLGAEDHDTHEPAGLGHLEEGHEICNRSALIRASTGERRSLLTHSFVI